MNRIVCVLCLMISALFLTACAGDTSLYIASSHPVTESSCLPNTSIISGGGILDTSLQQEAFGTYILGLQIQNEMDNSDTSTSPSSRNHFYLRHLLIEANVDGEVIEEVLDVSGACAPGGTLLLSTSIIGTDTFKAMNAAASTDELKTADIKIKAKGKLAGGQWVVSPGYHFPISFYSSGGSPSVDVCEGNITTISGSECLSVPEGQDGTMRSCETPEDNPEENTSGE